MAMSDRLKCWDTPCVCGYNYEDYSDEKKLKIVSAVLGLDEDSLKSFLNQSTVWQPMETAPKGATKDNPSKEHWILAVNKYKEQRVIRWCMEYPYQEGCWMFAYEPNDYIDGVQTFEPVAWMELPEYEVKL